MLWPGLLRVKKWAILGYLNVQTSYVSGFSVSQSGLVKEESMLYKNKIQLMLNATEIIYTRFFHRVKKFVCFIAVDNTFSILMRL